MVNELYLIDCMEHMKPLPDNHYDLAVVDPEYGIGESGGKERTRGGKTKHIKKSWDNSRPSKQYFQELFRVSKNQIIWGANYFVDYLPPSMGWICWDKKLDNSDYSDFELAFTSFNRAAKIYRHSKNGGSRTPAALADIIHPCQKPTIIYKWILRDYAELGWSLLDTHSGSGTLREAAYDMGFDIDSCENDPDYFTDNKARFQTHIKQGELFDSQEIQELIFD